MTRPWPRARVAEALRAYPVLVDEERAAEAEGLLRGLIAAQVPPAALRHALLSGDLRELQQLGVAAADRGAGDSRPDHVALAEQSGIIAKGRTHNRRRR